ncbi:MAG TPA: MFS transporter, partial [Micromonosporaceae bacterium]
VGAIGLLLFVLSETRIGDDALIPLRFFRNQTFSLLAISRVIFGAGMFGAIQLLPLYLQIVKGASPTKSGLLMIPLTGGIMLSSIASGQLISRTGRYKVFPIIGALLLTGSLAAMHFIGADTPFWQTAVYMTVFGLGLGNILQPITLAVQNAMPPKDIGVATSSATFFQQVGATIGVTAFLSILFSTVGNKIKDAYEHAGHTASFNALLKDPAVLKDPHNSKLLGLLHGGGGLSGSDLNDTSFLNGANKGLAHPFFVGFSNSMDLVFVLGAAVVAIGFVLMLFLREIPLRTQSGMQAAASEAAQNAGTAPVAEPAPEPVAALVPPVEPPQETLNDDAVGGQNGRHTAVDQKELPPQAPQESGVERSPMNGADSAQMTGMSPGSSNVVRGRVRQPNGAPVAQAAITLIDPTGRQAGRQVTGRDGSYQLLVPRQGHYVLIARAPSHQPQAQSVEVNGAPVDFDVILSGSAGLVGTIRSSNGEPVARAMVTVTDAGGEVVTARATNVAGTYSITDLVAGDYTLVVTASGYRPTALLVTIPTAGKAEQD